nr:zinc finger BED domain-containing protein DAYSLEEPER-like [Tanacetum cinerariifolium]
MQEIYTSARSKTASVPVAFDFERCRHEIARMILLQDYPLHMVEHKGFMTYKFNMAGFNNIQGDCVATYLSERSTIENLNARMPGRICLTLDVWNSNNTTGYVFITASELKKEFSHLDTLYPDYFKSPSGEDWNIVDNLCTYLKLIFDTAMDKGIHQLFLDYAAGDVSGHLSNGDGHGNGLTDFNDFIMESASQQSKSELDQYLEESLLPRSHEFDVMRLWKLNELKYPTLSKMARDILTLHVSTINPESVFDTGVKEMDRYRCTLKPEMVDALYCA